MVRTQLGGLDRGRRSTFGGDDGVWRDPIYQTLRARLWRISRWVSAAARVLLNELLETKDHPAACNPGSPRFWTQGSPGGLVGLHFRWTRGSLWP